MSALNVTIVQADLHWHAADKNRDMFSTIVRGQGDSTDLVVLPEMLTTGFTMDAEAHAEKMDGPSMEWLADLASSANAAVCGSIIVEESGKFLNRFVFMRPDRSYETYDKKHLFRLADEHQHYTAGNELITIDLHGWRLRPMVCYDLRFPVWSRNSNAYDLLLYVANWPSRRQNAWETLLRARAIENLSYVVGVNRTGTDGNGIPYAGGSAVIDFMGNTIVDLGDHARTATVCLEMDSLVTFRERFPFHADADRFSLLES